MKKRFIDFLRQGLTPEKLAICVALGGVLGVFPVLGSTTLLCGLAAWAGRLNQPAIQSVNFAVYPLQLALLIPFYRFGEWLFHAPRLAITTQGVRTLLQSGILHAIHVLWDTTMRAIVGWGLTAPFLAVVLYLFLVPFFRRLKAR